MNKLINEINETTSSSISNEKSISSNIPNEKITSNQCYLGKFKQAANDVITKQVIVSDFNQSSFEKNSSDIISLENMKEKTPQILHHNDTIEIMPVEIASLEKNKKKKEKNCFFTIFDILFKKKIKQ